MQDGKGGTAEVANGSRGMLKANLNANNECSPDHNPKHTLWIRCHSETLVRGLTPTQGRSSQASTPSQCVAIEKALPSLCLAFSTRARVAAYHHRLGSNATEYSPERSPLVELSRSISICYALSSHGYPPEPRQVLRAAIAGGMLATQH